MAIPRLSRRGTQVDKLKRRYVVQNKQKVLSVSVILLVIAQREEMSSQLPFQFRARLTLGDTRNNIWNYWIFLIESLKTGRAEN